MSTIYLIDAKEPSLVYQETLLKNAGFSVVKYSSAQDAIAFFESDRMAGSAPDIIVENLYMSVEQDPLLEYICHNVLLNTVPVMIVSELHSDVERAKAFDLNADDYWTKPLCVVSFLARIRAFIRKSGSAQASSAQLQYKGILLDDARHQVLSDGRACALTLKEYDMLRYFLTHIGTVVSPEALLFAVWKKRAQTVGPTVRIHVNSLRNKLGEPGRMIQTIRNVGYKME